jgi:hypothetical protein
MNATVGPLATRDYETAITTLPVLDETLVPITVGIRGFSRAATVQETRAIKALADVIDDQPAPPATLFAQNIFDWSGQNPDGEKPRVHKIALRKTVPSANAMVEVTVQPRTRMFSAPAFERMPERKDTPPTSTIQPIDVTTRDEMLAVAREVAARATQPKTDDVMKVADLMPFGQATLRLFCY